MYEGIMSLIYRLLGRQCFYCKGHKDVKEMDNLNPLSWRNDPIWYHDECLHEIFCDAEYVDDDILKKAILVKKELDCREKTRIHREEYQKKRRLNRLKTAKEFCDKMSK